jgi:hypothetical protein
VHPNFDAIKNDLIATSQIDDDDDDNADVVR